jgi:hypothetical protein
MATKVTTQAASPSKEYGNSAETSFNFGIGMDKLKQLRLSGKGPEFRVVGHRTIIYDWKKFQAWLSSLPRGGGVEAGATNGDH